MSSEFESDLDALLSIIEVNCFFEVYPFIEKQVSIYNSDVFTNKTARDETHQMLKVQVKKIRSLISKQYTLKLQGRYYTEEGLNLFIFYTLFDKAVDNFKDKLMPK